MVTRDQLSVVLALNGYVRLPYLESELVSSPEMLNAYFDTLLSNISIQAYVPDRMVNKWRSFFDVYGITDRDDILDTYMLRLNRNQDLIPILLVSCIYQQWSTVE